MSRSYSSLDCVLSHWAHFTVPRFVCVYVCVFVCYLVILHMCCSIVIWWGGSGGIKALILRTFLQCFDTVGCLCCRVLEAPSASQQVNRKDTRLEASGQNKSYDIHIQNFDVSYGDKCVNVLKEFKRLRHFLPSLYRF